MPCVLGLEHYLEELLVQSTDVIPKRQATNLVHQLLPCRYIITVSLDSGLEVLNLQDKTIHLKVFDASVNGLLNLFACAAKMAQVPKAKRPCRRCIEINLFVSEKCKV